MAESPKDQPIQDPSISQLLSQAQQLVEEIKSIRAQTEDHLKQAELSRKSADSEALFAFNAKKACEEHATTIAGVKGTVEADANVIATNKQRSDEALAALTTAKANADGDLKAIEIRRKEIDGAAVTISQSATSITKAADAGVERLKEIDASKESAEDQFKRATESAKAAADAAQKADSALQRAEKSSADSATLAATASESNNTAGEMTEQIKTLLAQAKTSEQNLAQVLQHLANSDEIATGHEKRVEALTVESQRLITSVEGLLPGATSAGLASSFNKQQARFTGPQKQWLLTFVGCIVALVVLALPSFLSAVGWTTHPTDPSWNATWRSVTLRLPIVLPIVWLAIYAGRNYMMSLRMEEDYAYKEAISTAFEGYKREMEKIGVGDGDNPTPLTILCTNILRAIAERPGRIYEGRQKDITLLTEVQEAVEKSTELSKKKLATH